eukprot:scaffold6933_cov178-Amphora_coffeaeformis.AAC.4
MVEHASRVDTIEQRLMLRTEKSDDGFIPPRGRTYFVGLNEWSFRDGFFDSSPFLVTDFRVCFFSPAERRLDLLWIKN